MPPSKIGAGVFRSWLLDPGDLISLYIRLQMKESPIFQQIKSTGMTSATPLKEAFTVPENFKRFLITLFGATAGQGVVWYTGQFFALFFMQTILKVPARDAQHYRRQGVVDRNAVLRFVRLAFRQDRTQKIIMAGLLLAAVSYRIPGTNIGIYPAMQRAAGNNVTHVDATKNKVTGATVLTPQTVGRDRQSCSGSGCRQCR